MADRGKPLKQTEQMREIPPSFQVPLNHDFYTSGTTDVPTKKGLDSPTKGNQMCKIKGLGVHTEGAYQIVEVSRHYCFQFPFSQSRPRWSNP